MALRSEIRWNPPVALTVAEQRICRRLTRTGRLFRFLRLHRHELLNEDFQAKLAAMYAEDYEPGRPPVPPGLLVLVTLLQAYTDVSDADAVHHALFDKRWQMVLDCMGCEDREGDGKAPFSQGLLAEFRFRLLQADMDRELVRRTVDLARTTKDFGFKALKVALDSAPLWGAGRVEDTFNLIGHGLLVCVACAADVADVTADEVLAAAALQSVGKSSVKAGLDIDWDEEGAKKQALNQLLLDVTRFQQWLARQPEHNRPEKQPEYDALEAAVAQLNRLVGQDTEPDPGGGARIRKGTAPDRQISVEDPEMRHGRKSKSTKITGYKAHVGYELEEQLVLDALVTQAHRPESEGGDEMRPNIEFYAPVAELNIDRGYLASAWVTDLDAAGVPVYAKPWNPTNGGRFQKSDFTIDLERRQVTCPAGEIAPFPSRRGVEGRRQVSFTSCSTCELRALCTESARGRSVDLHENEALLQTLWERKRTPEGRKKLRERVGIEHALAHVRVYQPRRARYVGTRKNTLALRRAGAIVNLQTIDARSV